jgi:hypothetical protein
LRGFSLLRKREELKNQGELLLFKKSFFSNALNIGFFLCYFRRRVELEGDFAHVGHFNARSRKH